VSDGFNDVARASFAFGADHGCAFGYATKSFPEIPCSTHEGDFVRVLVDVMFFISRSEYLKNGERLRVFFLLSVIKIGRASLSSI
jgi:hypothetical protein